MKKLILIFTSIFFLTNAQAQLIEYNQCYRSDNEKNWNKNSFKLDSSFGVISREAYKKLEKSLGSSRVKKALKNNKHTNVIDLGSETVTEFRSLSDIKILKKAGAVYKPTFEKNSLSINVSNGKITHLKIQTTDFNKLRTDQYKNEEDWMKFMYEKTSIENYFIKSYADNIIIAKKIISGKSGGISDFEADKITTINLENGSMTTQYDGWMSRYLCNNKKKSSSSYIDYWWAVILIIAITFFIFTQSGKRLKKIRRK
jgi:hypothetical protein